MSAFSWVASLRSPALALLATGLALTSLGLELWPRGKS